MHLAITEPGSSSCGDAPKHMVFCYFREVIENWWLNKA